METVVIAWQNATKSYDELIVTLNCEITALELFVTSSFIKDVL